LKLILILHLPSFFIFLLFLAIEISPIFAKLVAPKGEYDFKLKDQETAVKTWKKQEIDHKKQLLKAAKSALKQKAGK